MLIRLFLLSCAVAASIIAFVSSRGIDGDFFGAIWAYGVLAIVYGLGQILLGPVSWRGQWLTLLLMETGAAVALSIDPQLKEMSGMLYIFIPCFILGVAIVGGGMQGVFCMFSKE
jgi:hypothetical protein